MRPSRYSAGLAGAGETGYVLAYNTTEKQVASITKPSRMYLLYRAGWSSRLMVSPSQLRARPVMRTQPRSVLIRAAIAEPKKSKLAGSRMSVYAFMSPSLVPWYSADAAKAFRISVKSSRPSASSISRHRDRLLRAWRDFDLVTRASVPLEGKNRKIEQIHTSWMRGVGGRFTRARLQRHADGCGAMGPCYGVAVN